MYIVQYYHYTQQPISPSLNKALTLGTEDTVGKLNDVAVVKLIDSLHHWQRTLGPRSTVPQWFIGEDRNLTERTGIKHQEKSVLKIRHTEGWMIQNERRKYSSWMQTATEINNCPLYEKKKNQIKHKQRRIYGITEEKAKMSDRLIN